MKKTTPNRRVLRERFPADLMKQVKAVAKQYGGIGRLADKTGINYPNLHTMITEGMGTPENIKKIYNALKEAA